MDRSIAEEIYSESLQLTKSKAPSSSSYQEQDDSLDFVGDDDLWQENVSDEDSGKLSDLSREWERRRDQFHTIGYRDGVIAGKEASAQEGFNVGFRQSVMVGYNWGLVRGVTSALAFLPDELREKMMETPEKSKELQRLHEAVRSLSTTDALKLFSDDLMAKKAMEEHANGAAATSSEASLTKQTPGSGRLEKYFRELRELLAESSAMEVHLPGDK